MDTKKTQKTSAITEANSENSKREKEVINSLSETYFHKALSKQNLEKIGFEISYNPKDYKNAENKLFKKPITYYDVCNGSTNEIIMQMLRDNKEIIISSNSGKGSITLNKIHEAIMTAPDWIIERYLTEEDDIISANCLIQYISLGEVIFV